MGSWPRTFNHILDIKVNCSWILNNPRIHTRFTIESGVDFEKRIAGIYQTCRTNEEINAAFDKLQQEMEESIVSSLSETRQTLLENFDPEVHEKLRMNYMESKAFLDKYENWLWEITRYYLGDNADFADHDYSFTLKTNPFSNEDIDPGPYRIGKNVEDAHVYRPGHSLAQRILNEVKGRQLACSEIVFDYSHHPSIISVLKPLIGRTGVLKVSSYTVEAFEAEDSVIVSALDDNNETVEPEIIKKIFTLSTVSSAPCAISPDQEKKLDELEQGSIAVTSTQIAERNNEFFDDEMNKMDNWAEDVKKALELDLRKLDIDIKAAKTNAKKIMNLEEKLKAQRAIKDSEKRRNEMRKKLYEAQDEVEVKKEKLLESIEAQLKQRSTLKSLFTISWKIV